MRPDGKKGAVGPQTKGGRSMSRAEGPGVEKEGVGRAARGGRDPTGRNGH